RLQNNLERIARILLARYVNLKLVYISTRSRAYTNDPTTLNPEPFAYETGFGVKWTIEDQINGAANLNYNPARGPVVAPLLLWGPYFWADGPVARSDGFNWLCSDVVTDFTHPSRTGITKLANHLLAFFETDPSATPWFLKKPAAGQTPALTVSSSSSNILAGGSVSLRTSAVAKAINGSIIKYVWNFDDGGFSYSQNPIKIYPAPGTYHARVTAEDNFGNTATAIVSVTVN